MNAQLFSSPPRWLPLRLLLGSGIVAGLLTQVPHKITSEALVVPAPGLWARCGMSLMVLIVALLLAACLGLAVGLLARQIHPQAERLAAFLGRVLACLPVAALAWGFVAVWIGEHGWPVETLLPALLPEAQTAWQTTLARTLWEFLAPTLVLAVPLTGEVIHSVIMDATATADLDSSLRARGVPRSSQLWHHHLRQLLPLLRVRLQSLCLVAPVYLIIVEDVLRFMGWGGWMAQVIRAGEVQGLALGIFSGGVMMALLCGLLQVLRGRLKEERGCMPALSWQPWFLWALALMALPALAHVAWIILWFALLAAGAAGWQREWKEIEAQLPVDAARSFGASEFAIWRAHIMPVQFRMLAAWLCSVLAQTLLWIVFACAVRPVILTELGGPLAQQCHPLVVATLQDAARILADPSALLHAGGCIALVALCLIQLSRIVQPRPF